MDFVGCKLVLWQAGLVLTYQRDDFPDLAWRGKWDLPGGGREGLESPEACVLRELEEEFGLALPPARLLWRREYPSVTDPARRSHFFAGRLEASEVEAIRFGQEGQRWAMMGVADWLDHPEGVPELQARSRTALGDLGWL